MARPAETVVSLGPLKSMVGIATLPTEMAAGLDSTCAVILNAGIIHRVGPNRLHVELARALADAGVPAVRLDLSGIGDSDPRGDSLMPLEAALADVREALDTLVSARGMRRFLLVGLCSGANHAIISAASDERISGVALIDPLIPRTRRYYVNHYIGRITRARSWLNLLRSDHPLWNWIRGGVSGRNSSEVAGGDAPDPADVQQYLEGIYGRVCGRGVRMLAVFTSDLELQHNYREQILDAFPRIPLRDCLELHFFGEADHIFSAERHRRRLVETIVAWSKWTG